MNDQISTTAEAHENDVMPRIHEVHSDPEKGRVSVPPRLAEGTGRKSPARWAYERLIVYIQNFESQLDAEHEVAMGFTGGDAGVIRIEGMGYFDPDIVTFYGSDLGGAKTQVIQHVTQLNVLLRALPKQIDQPVAHRIGFRLARDLDTDGTDET
ncbi:DUF6173 family protein [Roseisalinus antarcticus]|uniref:Uncharacterized protein n=1 Tax=Roseisalinus antarcticus TaxID=254357 RepID=A0A1Y5RQ00_9RHOB|nr:DUF6173 family protein [Roseisalinus antarcticus]SLN21559.1 hypothetical protein ROA7023_00568 [Roseisalinus antarcticus]